MSASMDEAKVVEVPNDREGREHTRHEPPIVDWLSRLRIQSLLCRSAERAAKVMRPERLAQNAWRAYRSMRARLLPPRRLELAWSAVHRYAYTQLCHVLSRERSVVCPSAQILPLCRNLATERDIMWKRHHLPASQQLFGSHRIKRS